MTLEIIKCVVFPIAWVPESDIGINTSNNGNLQLKKYKSIEYAEKKTPEEFYQILKGKVDTALLKKRNKLNP
jgi:hypothetical protein